MPFSHGRRGLATGLLTAAALGEVLARLVTRRNDSGKYLVLFGLIAMGQRGDRPDYAYSEGVTLEVYELASGATATAVIPASSGAEAVTFEVQRRNEMVIVRHQAPCRNW